MALPEQFVTPPRHSPVTGRVDRTARGLRTAGALALLSGILAAPAIAAAQGSAALSGKWQLSCSGRRGQVRQLILQIAQHGSDLSGSFSGPRRSGELSGTIRGDQVSLQIGAGGRSITLTGTSDGKSMTVHGRKGSTCSGSRQ